MLARLFRRVKPPRPVIAPAPRGRIPEGYAPYVPDDLGRAPRGNPVTTLQLTTADLDAMRRRLSGGDR